MYRLSFFLVCATLALFVSAKDPLSSETVRLIESRNNEKLTKELEEAAASGFRVVGGSAYDGVMHLVLQKPTDGTSYTYRVLNEADPFKFKAEYAKAGTEGYRIVLNTLMIRGKALKNKEIIAVLEKPNAPAPKHENLVLVGPYDKDMVDVLGKLQAKGFHTLGAFSPREDRHLVFLEKQLD